MASPLPEEVLSAGREFGRYRIVRLLGSGGMGSVYEATHIDLGKRVALKALHAHYVAHAEARERFLREGKLAAKLQHPHVVNMMDFGIEGGTPYLVMEFLEGEDLEAVLEREGRLFPEAIAEVLVPIVAGLASAHDQGIVHRDLKPQNIFLSRSAMGERVPKILDFGISKALADVEGRGLTSVQHLLGTPAYMSPEQVRSAKNLDDRCDQYALGVILYQCATGQLPFQADAVFELLRQVAAGSFVRPSARVPGLPPALEQIILKSMAASPDDRFETTRELGGELLLFASARTQLVWSPEFESRADTLISSGTSRPSESARPQTGPKLAPVSTPIGAPDRREASVARQPIGAPDRREASVANSLRDSDARIELLGPTDLAPTQPLRVSMTGLAPNPRSGGKAEETGEITDVSAVAARARPRSDDSLSSPPSGPSQLSDSSSGEGNARMGMAAKRPRGRLMAWPLLGGVVAVALVAGIAATVLRSYPPAVDPLVPVTPPIQTNSPSLDPAAAPAASKASAAEVKPAAPVADAAKAPPVSKTGKVKLQVRVGDKPMSATVTVDQTPVVYSSANPLVLPLGKHHLKIQAGKRSVTVDVELDPEQPVQTILVPFPK